MVKPDILPAHRAAFGGGQGPNGEIASSPRQTLRRGMVVQAGFGISWLGLTFFGLAVLLEGNVLAAASPPLRFQLPTANQAIFEKEGGTRYFVGTVGRPWTSGGYGCVRSSGAQLHEGLDIRCLQRDRQGEPTDPVLATADGTVAYINANPSLSNYGRYLVVRHQVEGLEIYSLYAHLRAIQPGLKTGQAVRAGEKLGTLGRSANTREGISKERAHLHFELNVFLNDQFARWYRQTYPGQRNDHGNWNGQNLLGFDPQAVFLAQRAEGRQFSLLQHLRSQPELCRVQVRVKDFPWVRRYRPLMRPNPRAEREGIAGYELALNFIGIPFEVIPRAASELRGAARYQLLSVNETEQQRRGCRKLVLRRGQRWELAPNGLRLLNLLTH